LLATGSQAQSTAGVNEACGPNKLCSSGLYCVKVEPDDDTQYDYVCCECDQSKLKGYTDKKKECCKPELTSGIDRNPIFSDAKASDNRVEVVVFDKIMENVKKCQEARLAREEACWDGGNPGHIQAINQLKQQNANLSNEKREWIDDKMVYYTTKSSYESALSNFKYKCPLSRTEDIEDDLEDMQDDFEDKKPIDCDDLEDFIEECEKCQDAAADFLDDCFNDNVSNMPEEYFDMFDKSGTVWKQAKDLLSKVKSESLCE
jgi:hypothetical protein